MNAEPPDPAPDLAKHAQSLRALARGLVADTHLADDAAQSALTSAMARGGGFSRNWLFTVLRNLIRRDHRDRKRRERRELYQARHEALPSSQEVAQRLETERRITAALARVEEPYKTTLILRFYDQLPPREIARRAGVPVATVRTRLARGLERLRVELDAGHPGGRAAWVVALIPFLQMPPAAGVALPAGVILMKSKMLMIAAVIAAVLVSMFIFTRTAGTGGGVGAAEEGAREQDNSPEREIAKAAAIAQGGRTEAASEAGSRGSVNITESRHAGESRPHAAPRVVEGRVIDLEARGVAGIALGIAPAHETTIVTNPDGTFIFTIPQNETEGGSGRVTVASDRYISVLSGAILQQPGTQRMLIVVAPKISISGNIHDVTDRPILGARLDFRFPPAFRAGFQEVLDASVDEEWSAVTDDQGFFEFKDYPAIPGAVIGVARAGFVPKTVESPLASTWTLNISLQKQEYETSLSGIVIDPADRPVAGARVATGDRAVVLTDDEGKFSLQVGELEEVSVMAVQAGRLPAIQRVTSILQNGKRVWSGPCILRIGDAALSAGGTVVDAAGKPVANAHVWVANATWFGLDGDTPRVLESAAAGEGTAPQVRCDANGKFVIKGLLNQNYQFVAVDPLTLAAGQADAVAGSANIKITIPDGGIYDTISGQVVGRDGTPIAGVRVRPSRTAFHITMGTRGKFVRSATAAAATTDVEGKFKLTKIARAELYLVYDSPAIVPESKVIITDPPVDIRVVLLRRCHMKVELQNPAEDLDGFSVLDSKGETQFISIFGGESQISLPLANLQGGKSETVVADETSTTLILTKHGEEVRRVHIQLDPGKLTVVRP